MNLSRGNQTRNLSPLTWQYFLYSSSHINVSRFASFHRPKYSFLVKLIPEWLQILVTIFVSASNQKILKTTDISRILAFKEVEKEIFPHIRFAWFSSSSSSSSNTNSISYGVYIYIFCQRQIPTFVLFFIFLRVNQFHFRIDGVQHHQATTRTNRSRTTTAQRKKEVEATILISI